MNLEKQQLPGNSWTVGNLPFGCKLCMQGMKVVYFMGGDCNNPPHCKWYCPLSMQRRSSRAHFVDELAVDEPDDINSILDTLKREIEAVKAQGMSFTGGDPLSSSRKKDMVCAIIEELKVTYGSDFHIHLYTSGVSFDTVIAEKLDLVGLDSIRFHPDPADFDKIEMAMGYSYSVGAEVPVIPWEENHRYIMELITYLQAIGADYINLNEFEMCEPNQQTLLSKGFKLKSETVATVEGSREYAEKIIQKIPANSTLTIHFCSVAVKDQVQIRERYMRRAEQVKYPYEEISEDGCLLFLRIQGPVSEVEQIEKILRKKAKIPAKMMNFNPPRGTLDLPPFLAEEEGFLEILTDFRIKCGIYEVLPFREPELAEIREYTPVYDNLIHH